MNEIYWITRLDVLRGLLTGMAVILGIICFSVGLFAVIDGKDEIIMSRAQRRKILLRSLVAFVVFALGSAFTPSTKEMMLIWGLGNTVDYMQENETVQQLPDKCGKALEAWVESLSEEE